LPVSSAPSEPLLPFDQRPAHQQYPFAVIGLALELMLDAAVSLRGVSAVFRVFQKWLPQLERIPSANGGQLWLLRIGLYEVLRPKEKVSDRVWLIDHTIQLGTRKCLLVVSCRLGAWQEQRRPLQHGDLEVLALEPVTVSNGPVVQEQLKHVAEQTGVPCLIVSDHGSDVKCGVAEFCRQHPQTRAVHDIAHATALVVKRELQGDARWLSYMKALGRVKRQLQQTPLACLVPPHPKTKARYMNLQTLVDWGVKTLAWLDGPQVLDGAPVPTEVVQEKLGWLTTYREALTEWQEVMTVVSTTLTYVRMEGYHRGASRELAEQLRAAAGSKLGQRVADGLVQVVAREGRKAKRGERLLGSSECLESLIGKGKRLEGQQSKSGFTKMVLGMAAAVVQPTREFLARAFATVKVTDVWNWCQTKLGRSVQSQRIQAFAGCPSGTEIG
jgi:hypothetical protein